MIIIEEQLYEHRLKMGEVVLSVRLVTFVHGIVAVTKERLNAEDFTVLQSVL